MQRLYGALSYGASVFIPVCFLLMEQFNHAILLQFDNNLYFCKIF